MIYHFRLVTGRKDFFLREYHLLSTDTLYDFHRFIQNDLDFDDSQMAAFFAVDKKGKQHQYSLFDTGDGAMDTIVIEQLVKGKYGLLMYTFDFFHNRSLTIEFLGEVERLSRKSYPLVVEAKGESPDQFEERPLPDPIPELKPDLDDQSESDADDDDLDDDDDDELEDDNGENEDGYDASDLDFLEEVQEV